MVGLGYTPLAGASQPSLSAVLLYDSSIRNKSASTTPMNTLEADYLVVGAGAMGMAFTDVLMTETEASVVMVDRRHQPGGHWNDAYPFVRLHQPSSFYGVNSRPLGSGAIDTHGWNKGLYELATNSEVCAYFGQVMQRQFLPSGRVRYFPLCEYRGDGRFTSSVSDEAWTVQAGKIVDATYMDVSVPSVSPPPFAIDEGVQLGAAERAAEAGRCSSSGTSSSAPARPAWTPACFCWPTAKDPAIASVGSCPGIPGCWTGPTSSPAASSRTPSTGVSRSRPGPSWEGTSYRDVFERINAAGQLLRLDDDVWPTMYRCATVTQAELEQLRRIKDVVRLGHVQSASSGTRSS